MSEAGARITPVAYQPPSSSGPVGGRGRRGPVVWVLAAMGLLLALAVLLFALTRAVRLEITPDPDSLNLDGGFGLVIGEGRLLLPGDYSLIARRQGYEDLAASFTVTNADQQTFRFELKLLPGRLTLVSDPPGAEVFVDDNPRGTTPLADLELAAGPHRLLLRAPRYQAYEAEVLMEGGGVAQTVNAKLEQGWAPVSIASRPGGAEILVDGAVVGRTPQTVEVGAGAHELTLQRAGYQTWRDRFTVRAGEPLKLAEAKLVPASGNLRISSEPAGAAVTVNGEFRGQTPLSLSLAPGRSHRLRLSAPGHQPAERSLEFTPEQSQDLRVVLEPILGAVVLAIEPADAKVSIDGRAIEAGTTRLQLTAVAHRVEVAKAGFATQSTTVTPRPGLEQRVEVKLASDADAQVARAPASATSQSGLKFVLIKPGAFTMGSERGTQGRQANEAQRKVRLTRPFYLATTEVSNAQFRMVTAEHSSGIHMRNTLNNEGQPVARVSWEDAVRYCIALSAQDGLPAAYVEDSGSFKLVQPVNTGYRLPSEAEWEWAARFAGGEVLRYPWGGSMPPTDKSGNFADRGADGLVPQVLSNYDDGYVVASPVGSFAASRLGLFDIGGNVAEWVHDRYTAVPSLGGTELADPFGPDTGEFRVIRGSSWAHGTLIQLRLAYRDSGDGGRQDVGFRVARYAQ
ncbi:MAG: PEGA domain-containing protein [Panacagrimonas sp.]